MDKDLLKDAKEAFERASEAESKNREAWIDDIRFARLNEQWPEKIKRQRELEGRPCLTINKLPSFIRQVTNDARQNRPSIKCHPVGDGADQGTAEVLNGLIRNIEYTSDAEVAYDTALDHAVTGGFGYIRAVVDYACEDAFDLDIKIERVVNPLTIYGDPRSVAADSSDWNEAFVTDMWSKAEFEKKWPKAQSVGFEGDTYEKNYLWFEDDEIRVAEWWTREEVEAELIKLDSGIILFADDYIKRKDLFDMQQMSVAGTRKSKKYKVTQRIITGAEVIETKPWAGKYIPIVPVYGDEIMVEGERHFISLVRFAKDPQQMFNVWRTASTELVALAPKAPYLGPKGAFDSNPEQWATANTVSHPYLEYDGPVAPQRQPFAGPPAGALQEAMNASDDMKAIMGLYDPSLGARSNETSGVAIMARQRQGNISTFNYVDNLSRAIKHMGRILVDLVPRVYDTPRMMRVIHEDGTNENVQVNAPFQQTPQQIAEQQQEGAEELQSITRLYDLTTGKYDVTCEVGPSYSTKREEAAAQMTEFIRAFPGIVPIAGDLMVKNFDWPGADDLAKRMKQMLPPQAQGQNPQLMQMQQQMQQMDGQARQAVGQLQQQLQKATQAAQDKAIENSLKQKDLEIRAYEAETERMKAMQEAQDKERDRQARMIEAASQPQPGFG